MSRQPDGERHDWLGYLDPIGLVVASAALSRLGLWPEPQGPAEGAAIAAALASDDPWPLFRDVLGWPAERVAGLPGGPPLPDALRLSLRDGDTLLEPDWAVEAPGGGHQLLVRIEAPGVLLDRRGALDGWEATPQQRFERLLRDTGVGTGILLGTRETGRKDGETQERVLRLVVARKGDPSGWLSWPLAALAEPRGRAMLGGLKLLLDDHALFTGAPSHRLPAILAESRAVQAEVSERLSGQVLAALHELLRGLDAADPALVREVAAREPHRLYEGLLTVLLRLIFILYAEDRGLMPSAAGSGAATLYEQGYSLGGLHVRLLDDRAAHADLMDERRGAWGRLLALFRLVERGAGDFMQARGGKLFSEAGFPFLLGRRSADDPERVLPVGDGCVLRILDALLVLDGERVAYRALSVEQIGAVYETVMGFTVECAAGPSLAIRAGKGNRVPVWVDLDALGAADRLRWLKERTGRRQFPAAVTAALRTAEGTDALAAALAPVVDARASPRGLAVAAGTPVLQPTEERRRTGSHYTPRALTKPIVEHALAPAFARLGPEATADELLDLKICDPAAGSGAFLVEACRQLADRLIAAWDRWPEDRRRMRRQLEAEEGQLHVEDDDTVLARRLVARRCLYGVDRNPLALDLARLGLWLLTLARRRPFLFFEHALRSGDSLVGLSNAQIKAVTWGAVGRQRSFVEGFVDRGLRAAYDLRAVLRSPADEVTAARAEVIDRDADRHLSRPHLVADALLHAFFQGRTMAERRRLEAEVEERVSAPDAGSWAALLPLQAALRAPPIGIVPFHWELEFPEVFQQPDPGFDAIVGNPPFAGKNTIAAGNHGSYPDWLRTLHSGAHGNADLAAHFFRRAFGLLRRGGAFGLIATNTIRQGDTRDTGLRRIVEDGGTIYRAVSRHGWEGEAAVVVAMVFAAKGELPGPAMLDGRPVRRISAYLVEGDLDASPTSLRDNRRKVFEGTKVYGAGFLFRDDAPATEDNTVDAMNALLGREPRSTSIVKPFLGGEEVYNDPQHRPFRFVMDLTGLTLDQAAHRHPAVLEILRRTVKPYRDTVARPRTRDNWWLFEEARPGLYGTIASQEQVLVTNCAATPHWAVAHVPNRGVFSNTLAVFAFSSFAMFAVLQSRVHELWARFFASTLEDRLRYTPSDCFETFPLPPGHDDAPLLEAAGRACHDHRAALMVAAGEGMTPTYNRFHREAGAGVGIATLRTLHADMDRAVLAAYGWDDLADRALPAFLTAETEDDHRYRGRLFWPAAFRDELLARLLRLNEERAAAERRL